MAWYTRRARLSASKWHKEAPYVRWNIRMPGDLHCITPGGVVSFRTLFYVHTMVVMSPDICHSHVCQLHLPCLGFDINTQHVYLQGCRLALVLSGLTQAVRGYRVGNRWGFYMGTGLAQASLIAVRTECWWCWHQCR